MAIIGSGLRWLLRHTEQDPSGIWRCRIHKTEIKAIVYGEGTIYPIKDFYCPTCSPQLDFSEPVPERPAVPISRESATQSRQSGMIPPECLPEENRLFHWLQSILARARRGFLEWLKP